MTDTINLDTVEKVDILIKQSYGFPTTDENYQWFQETAVKFNNSFNGEDILLDPIPEQPDFDSNGIVRTATEIGLNQNDFESYSENSSDKSSCSIVDDKTGTVRRFKLLILEQTPGISEPGLSWYKLDSSKNNVLQDTFQFNFKQYESGGQTYQPYLYKVNTQQSLSESLPFGKKGGNYFIELKSGILFFSDFNNFSNTSLGIKPTLKVDPTNNKPVLTIYKYIGRKGVAKQIAIKDSINDVTSPENNQIVVQKSDDTIHRYNGSSQTWIPIGGSGGGSSGSTQTYTNQILEQSGNEIQVPNDKHTLPFNQFTDVSGSETSFTFNTATTQLIYKFSFNLTWHNANKRGDTISEYQLMLSEDGVIFNPIKTFRLRNSLFSENFATIEHIIEKGSYITVKLQGKSINEDYLQKVNYTYFNPSYPTGHVVKPILEITKIGSRTIEAEALFNKDSNDNIYYTNGKVGIGTTNPTRKLDVSGNTLIRDDLTVDGFTVLKDISGTDASFNNVDICGNKLSAKDIYISGNIYQNGTLFSDGDELNINNLNFSGNITDKFNNIVVRTQGDTVTQISKLRETIDNQYNLSFFGQSVAIYNNYAIILAPGYRQSNGTNVYGYAYIYEFTNCTWTLKNTLFPNGSTYGLYDYYKAYDNFQLVAINDNYAVVGAPGYNIASGAIYIYERNSNGNWGNEVSGQDYRSYTQRIEYYRQQSYFGFSVAISDTYIAVGMKFDKGRNSNNEGSSYIYEKNGTNWEKVGNTLIASGVTKAYQNFGWSVAILKETTTGNGDYAVVGAPDYDIDEKSRSGAVFIYKRTVEDQVNAMLDLAENAGIDGVVCSPHELELVSKRKSLLSITPGIRLLNLNDDDVFISKPVNSDYGLQCSYAYAPRNLRKISYASASDGTILYGKKDLKLLNGVESDNDSHSPILGYAYDGHPIYGPFGFIN